MQKVHLWMEISADCPNRGRRSLTKMDRQGNVQSSVWTLQQILPEFVHHDFLQKLYAIFSMDTADKTRRLVLTDKQSPFAD